MKHLVFFVLILSLFSCATAREAKWKTIPEVNIPYERAWTIIVSTISERFDLEVVDAQSGYLRTSWKVIDYYFGIPDTSVRAVVRVEDRAPLKIKVKVEQQKYNSWTYQYYMAGNNDAMEQEILQELAGRLRKL